MNMKYLERINNFFVGVLVAVLIFFLLYSLCVMIAGTPYFSRDARMQWMYISPMIINMILARFMLVKWDLVKSGRGMMFVTLLGTLVILAFVR